MVSPAPEFPNSKETLPGRARRWTTASLLVGAAALLSLWACGPIELTLDRPWSSDRYGVVVLADGAGQPVESQPRLVGPGEPLSLEASAASVATLHAFEVPPAAQGGIDLSEAGVRFGGPAPVIRSSAAWSIRPQALGGSDTAWTPLAEVPAPLPFDLRQAIETGGCDPPLVETTVVPLTDYRIDQMAALDDERVYFAARPRDNENAPHAFGILESGQVRMLDRQALDGVVTSLSVDQGRLYGSAEGQYFELGADERFQVEAQPGPYARVVASGGRVLEFGSGGVRSRSGPPVARWSADTQLLAVTGPEQIFVATATAIAHYDGSSWTVEHVYPPTQERWLAIGGDQEAVGAGGVLGQLIVRSPAEASWRFQGSPFSVEREIRALTGLGGGRLLVTGPRGLLGIWSPDQLCALEATSNELLTVSAAPSRRVFFVGSGDLPSFSGDQPVILRLVLP